MISNGTTSPDTATSKEYIGLACVNVGTGQGGTIAMLGTFAIFVVQLE